MLPNRNKRKALSPEKTLVTRDIEVQSIPIENLFLVINDRDKLHFKRLKYKGCPPLQGHTQEFNPDTSLIDMNRDKFIRDVYQKMSLQLSRSTSENFHNLIKYMRWLDEHEKVVWCSDILSQPLIDDYMNWCLSQINLGQLKRGDVVKRKNAISWLLKQHSRHHDAMSLPSIKGAKDETKAPNSLDLETELKAVSKELFRAYRVLAKHFLDGTFPDIHPLFNETLFENQAILHNWDQAECRDYRYRFKQALMQTHPNNHIVRIAMLLTFMLTGMNFKPLADMRLNDVSFKFVGNGKYVFNSIKSRANYQEQDNTVGFSKFVKGFIEEWLKIATEMSKGDKNGYLFPFYNRKNDVISYSISHSSPQESVNRLLIRLGLPKINSSIFRKTKSDVVYRVTESVYLVAMMNNHNIKTTARSYVNGTTKDHEKSLNAALAAQLSIAKGESVEQSVSEAKFRFSDVLDDYEYQNLRKGKDRTREAKTPLGVRCQDNRKGSSQTINKVLERIDLNPDKSEIVCTDFLSCFECKEHAFVTDVDDIWAMLSFKDVLLQLQQLPAVNSMPEAKYIKLFNTVEAVLTEFKFKNPTNFREALEKLKDSPHPLYESAYSLSDLLEIHS